MQLADTVELMESADYKDRFKAEYLQTKIRYEKLKAMNNKIEAAKRTAYRSARSRALELSREEQAKNIVEMPQHDCPDELLREQQEYMGQYLRILEVRAEIEGVDVYEA